MLIRLKKFREFLGEEVWKLFIQAVVIGFLWFAVESGFAYVLQGFLSTIGLIPKVHLGRLAELYPTSVAGSVITLIGFGLIRSTVIFLRYHSANITSQAFIRHQRYQILKYSLENAQISSTSESVSLFNDRVTESGRVIQNFSSIINLTTAIVFFSCLALWMTPIEFLIGSFILAVALAPIRRLNKIVGTTSAGILTESRKVTHSMLVGLRNNFLLRIYGEVGPVVENGRASLDRYEHHYRRYSRIYCLNGSFPHFVGVIAVSTVTFISLKYLSTPSSALLAFFYLFFRIAQSASESSAMLNEARVYFSSFRTLFDFAQKARNAPNLQALQAGKIRLDHFERIDLDHLGFVWPNGAEVFENLSTSVVKGEMLLIKGESGAGKSTLLSLICGLLRPTSGAIRYNGQSLQEIDLTSISSRIGYVGPESYIIEGSLRENLLFAHAAPDRVSETEMQGVLRLVRLNDELEKAKIELGTHLNEFTQLSTGQKQRLALARALLRKPELLILDEATANLDADTEGKLIDSLEAWRRDVITIAVSHRDSFDRVANQSVRLKGA